MLSPEGSFFRDFLLDEAVKSVDSLSRDSARRVAAALGVEAVLVPVLLPGVKPLLPLAPEVTEEDRKHVENVEKVRELGAKGTWVVTVATGDDSCKVFTGSSPLLISDALLCPTQIVGFLTGGAGVAGGVSRLDSELLREVGPLLPTVAREVLPELNRRLVSRVLARALRDAVDVE